MIRQRAVVGCLLLVCGLSSAAAEAPTAAVTLQPQWRAGAYPAQRVLWSPRGDLLAVLSWEGLTLRRASDGRQMRKIQTKSSAFAISPDGKRFAWASAEGERTYTPRRGATGKGDWRIHLEELQSGRTLKSLRGLRLPALSLAFSPDGKMLASGGEDGVIRLWDVGLGRLVRQWVSNRDTKGLGFRGIKAMAFSPDGQQLVEGGQKFSLSYWRVADGTLERRIEDLPGGITSLAYAAGGQLLAAGGLWAGGPIVFDMAVPEKRIELSQPPPLDGSESPTSVSPTPDGRLFFCSGEGPLQIWRRENERLVFHLTLRDPQRQSLPWGTKVKVTSTALSPDGRQIAYTTNARRTGSVAVGSLSPKVAGETGAAK